MDQAFLLRAQRLLGQRRPAPLDHDLLVAGIGAQQAGSLTAQAASRCPAGTGDGDAAPASQRALATLLLAEEGWREAAGAQRGCFNRAVATRGGNARSTRLTGFFT